MLNHLPPLSLYVHLPWCVRKCPYCDFNSHALRAELEEGAYVDALLRDLAHEAALVRDREVQTIFFGGGTPSLFSPDSIARLLRGIGDCVAIAPGAEITLEANPGTVEIERFRGFREAGVNRLSIGIQSFDDAKLRALGRIHGRAEALCAAQAARAAGFDNFNLDLMYGLPGQTIAEVRADVETAIALQPPHLSVYQLTLEPHTHFHAHPPTLPDEDAIATMQDGIVERLEARGYVQYEVSAYARAGYECRHNRNYWEFGDYLGIGAGAHGKLSGPAGVTRYWKRRHPEAYRVRAGTAQVCEGRRMLDPPDLVAEFMLNALRLRRGFPRSLFGVRTGLSLAAMRPSLETAERRGLVVDNAARVAPTPLGWRYLNDTILLFVGESKAAPL